MEYCSIRMIFLTPEFLVLRYFVNALALDLFSTPLILMKLESWKRDFKVAECSSLFAETEQASLSLTLCALVMGNNSMKFDEFQILDLSFANKEKQLIQINTRHAIKIYNFKSGNEKQDFMKLLKLVVNLWINSEHSKQKTIRKGKKFLDSYLQTLKAANSLNEILQKKKDQSSHLHNKIVNSISIINHLANQKSELINEILKIQEENVQILKSGFEVKSDSMSTFALLTNLQNQTKDLNQAAKSIKEKMNRINDEKLNYSSMLFRKRVTASIAFVVILASLLYFSFERFYFDDMFAFKLFLFRWIHDAANDAFYRLSVSYFSAINYLNRLF